MKTPSPKISQGGKNYPWPLSLGMIVFAVLLSFVDLMFLNEVIGRVLDLSATESMLVAFGLGLVGIIIMASVGAMKAFGHDAMLAKVGLYTLWFTLGLSFVILRIFSATILQLDPTLGDEALFTLGDILIRQSDLVLGPIMLILYVATGVLALDGTKHLLMSPDFMKMLADRKKNRAKESADAATRAQEAETRRKAAEAEAAARAAEAEEQRRAAIEAGKLDKYYEDVMKQYRDLEAELMRQHKLISQNIEYIKRKDKAEKAFETKTKPGFINIFNDAVRSSQGEVVLLMNKYNGGGITEYREVVNRHNSDRNGIV